jgi:hypothetical protein
MCITNDDAISNGSKHNNVMKKKRMLEKGKGNQRSCNNRGKERNKRLKNN